MSRLILTGVPEGWSRGIMSHFFAAFGRVGSPPVQIRMDTRIYYGSNVSRSRDTGRCRGVVWMCNPGSATAAVGSGVAAWGPLDPDPTLGAVLRLFQAAAKHKPTEQPFDDDYLSVLNCFYSCDPLVAPAFAKWVQSSCGYIESVPADARFVLAAWGSDKPYGVVCDSIRAIGASGKAVFFHDPTGNPTSPIGSDFAKSWFPAHPLNPSFAASLPALAIEMARYL